MQSFASKYALRSAQGFARRYVAGASVADAIAAANQVQSAGLGATFEYLGPIVTTLGEADAATRAFIATTNELAGAGIEGNVSVKLSQLGLRVDRATCVDNLRRLLDPAATPGIFAYVGMEDSSSTQSTFDVFETLWQQEYRNVGIVVQANLRRSADDVRRLNALGARVRLVKGAYSESQRIAYRSKADINRSFIAIMERLLVEGTSPAIATHDRALIGATTQYAQAHSVSPANYEFHLLYGVRRDLQSALQSEGCRVRVCVPFGQEWFAYVMHRLGERPADVRFVIRSILLDRWRAPARDGGQ